MTQDWWSHTSSEIAGYPQIIVDVCGFIDGFMFVVLLWIYTYNTS